MANKKSKKSFPKDLIYIAIIAVLVVALLVTIFAGDKLSSVFGGLQPSDPIETETTGGNENAPLRTSVLSGNASFTLPEEFDGENCLEVHFINVAQGDGIAIMFPDGKKMLIDAGNSSSANPSSAVKNAYFDYLSDNLDMAAGSTIDYLIVTHPDADHVNMMSAVLDKYEVSNIYYNDASNAKKTTATYTTFMEKAKNEGATLFAVGLDSMAQTITGADYTVDLYAPGYSTFREEAIEGENKNILSVMSVLSYGGRKVMFTGDAEIPTEEWFMQTVGGTLLDVDVLKVGHHGSESCTSTAFLDYIKPEYAVISCNCKGNKYHHPHPETMNKLFDYGIVTYRTDHHGNIVLYIDGDGDFGFLPENNVPVENNKNSVNPKTITLSSND